MKALLLPVQWGCRANSKSQSHHTCVKSYYLCFCCCRCFCHFGLLLLTPLSLLLQLQHVSATAVTAIPLTLPLYLPHGTPMLLQCRDGYMRSCRCDAAATTATSTTARQLLPALSVATASAAASSTRPVHKVGQAHQAQTLLNPTAPRQTVCGLLNPKPGNPDLSTSHSTPRVPPPSLISVLKHFNSQIPKPPFLNLQILNPRISSPSARNP